MVRGELHERWPNFTAKWTATPGTFCGIGFARPAERLGSHTSATSSSQAYLDNGVKHTKSSKSGTNEQKVIVGGLFIWEETKTAEGMGQGGWERTGMEQERERGVKGASFAQTRRLSVCLSDLALCLSIAVWPMFLLNFILKYFPWSSFPFCESVGDSSDLQAWPACE